MKPYYTATQALIEHVEFRKPEDLHLWLKEFHGCWDWGNMARLLRIIVNEPFDSDWMPHRLLGYKAMTIFHTYIFKLENLPSGRILDHLHRR